MKLVFGGHNSWILHNENTTIYFDPIFNDGKGIKADGGKIFPPRVVDFGKLPKPDFVFISHEHTDHFHIPTILNISRDAVIVVGNLMPQFVTDILFDCGFKNIIRQQTSVPERFGSFKITLYNAGSRTAFWEQRVTQLLVEGFTNDFDPIYFSVDAALSEYFIDDVNRGGIKPPKIIAISNNSESSSDSDFGTLDDLRTSKLKSDKALFNLRLLKELFIDFVPSQLLIDKYLIVGGGFVKDGYNYNIESLNRQLDLVNLANSLFLSKKAIAPMPGSSYEIGVDSFMEYQCEFIWCDEVSKHLTDKVEKLSLIPTKTCDGFFKDKNYQNHALQNLKNYLPCLVKALLLSGQGRLASTMTNFNGNLLGNSRILIVFILDFNEPNYQIKLDFQKSKFIEDFTPLELANEIFPFGLIIHLCDWEAVHQGQLQIWDIADSMKSWYVDDNPFYSLISFLYIHLGEQLRPDLAFKALKSTLK